VVGTQPSRFQEVVRKRVATIKDTVSKHRKKEHNAGGGGEGQRPDIRSVFHKEVRGTSAFKNSFFFLLPETSGPLQNQKIGGKHNLGYFDICVKFLKRRIGRHFLKLFSNLKMPGTVLLCVH